jgi:hypothetical protein
MSGSYTYDRLVELMQTYPETSSAEYIADIPDLIGNGEVRLIRDLNVEFFDFTDSALLVVNGDNTVTKPEDIIVHRTFQIQNATGQWDPLEYRSNDYVRLHGADEIATGQPRYIADHDEFEWIVSPYANDDYTIRCRFVRRPDGLSASNQTTWISTYAGDALLAASLMEAEHWLKADDRYEDMKKKYYEELLPTIRLELRRAIRSGDYSPFKPAAQATE